LLFKRDGEYKETKAKTRNAERIVDRNKKCRKMHKCARKFARQWMSFL
jgi:hypothetical protein